MKYLILLLLVCFSLHSSAQHISKADSVIATLNVYSDIEKIDTLISLAFFPLGNVAKARESIIFAQAAKKLSSEAHLKNKYAKALELEGVALGELGNRAEGIDSIKKSLVISKDIKSDVLLAEGNCSLGILYEESDDLSNAIFYYKLAIKHFDILKNHPNKNLVTNNLANAYYHNGNYSEALTYHLKGLAINEQHNDYKKMAKKYGGLSLVYRALGNYKKANEYVQKAIKIQKKANQNFDLSISYLSAGNIQRKLKKYDSAFYFNKAALHISEALEDTIGIAFAYHNIASVYFSKNEFTKAIDYFIKSNKLFKQAKFNSKVLVGYNNLSICYRHIGKLEKALKYAHKAYVLAEEINNIPLLSMVTETLYETYYAFQNYKQALEYRNLNITFNDSLLNQEKVRELAKIETNYEIKSRDSEIDLLNKKEEIAFIKAEESEKIKYFLLIIAILLLFIIGYIYNRYLAQKKIKTELTNANEQLKELNISKNKFFAIIAHDLRNPITAFNNLTSALVDNFKHLQEDQLVNYLKNLNKSSSQINGLLENLLQWALSRTNNININIKEFDLSDVIQKNIDLLAQNAAQKNISLSFDHPAESTAYGDQSTIDMVFRNIISNAIKFSGKDSEIHIKTSTTDKNVEISIRDEGIGMSIKEVEMLFDITKDTAKIGSSPEKGSGLGLLLSQEYIKKSHGEIRVFSVADKGTTFTIVLPRTQLRAA